MAAHRYLVFGGKNYYALGGWDDLIGTFDLVAAAREFAAHYEAENKDDPDECWTHIVDRTPLAKATDNAVDPDGEPVDERFSDEPLPPAEAEEVARLRDKIAAVRPPPAPGLSAVTVARAFEVMLPKHAKTTIYHNPNGASSVSSWCIAARVDFTNAVEQQKVEATGELWVLDWTYLNGGNMRLAAASLPALAAWLEANGLAFGS